MIFITSKSSSSPRPRPPLVISVTSLRDSTHRAGSDISAILTSTEVAYVKRRTRNGPDGSGSAMGKKLGVHDFSSPEVQKMSDDELADAISKGKNKMPAYRTMKPEDVKGLVAYVRSLTKK